MAEQITAAAELDALRVAAEKQAAAHARMLELNGGIGQLSIAHPEMFEDMLAWDDLSENDHADTVLALLAARPDAPAPSDEYKQGWNDAASMFLRNPPGDWKPFGSSIDPVTGKGPDYALEFAGEDEGGLPLWERPASPACTRRGVEGGSMSEQITTAETKEDER